MMKFLWIFMQISCLWSYAHNFLAYANLTQSGFNLTKFGYLNGTRQNKAKSNPIYKLQKEINNKINFTADILLLLDESTSLNSGQKITLEQFARHFIVQSGMGYHRNHLALGRLTKRDQNGTLFVLNIKFDFLKHSESLGANGAVYDVQFDDENNIYKNDDPNYPFDLDQNLVQLVIERDVFNPDELGSRPTTPNLVIFVTYRPISQLQNLNQAIENAKKSDFNLLIVAKRFGAGSENTRVQISTDYRKNVVKIENMNKYGLVLEKILMKKIPRILH